MKIARTMLLRRWAITSSRSTGTTTVNNFRQAIAPGTSPISFFCTGPSPDILSPTMNTSIHSSARSFSSKSTLLEILSREENEEVDTGNLEIPQDLSDLRHTIQESWKIVESGASTDLFKIDSSNKIQVSFHCQDTLEVEVEGEEYDTDSENEADEPVRFTVTITKAGTSSSLNFACFSEYGEVKIDGVSTTSTSTAEYVHQHQGTLPKIEYQGPDFNDLAEDLQEVLVVYLDEECGVTSDVAAFIAMAADYREEVNYVDFLKEAQSIVS